MPLANKPIKVQPTKADQTFDVAVYVTYHENGKPFVFAHIDGDGSSPYLAPNARLIERYEFTVANPFINKPLDGGAKQ